MILVTGGTGFIGRHLVARLVQANEDVRVLARTAAEVPGAEVMQGDIRDLSSLALAARGCRAVVHLVGIVRERRGAAFRQIHVRGTETVLRACQDAGVTRLLHVSALGTRAGARSRYHRTKWEAEELVRGSSLQATIFRPSVIFGEGNSFIPSLRNLVRRMPVIPIVGSGTALVQPIWVADVVQCFVAALDGPATAGRTYELGGPETYGFEQLLDLVSGAEGIDKSKVHLPLPLVRPAVAILSRLVPGFPLTSDQLAMLREDNVCDTAEMLQTFGIEPASIRDHLSD